MSQKRTGKRLEDDWTSRGETELELPVTFTLVYMFLGFSTNSCGSCKPSSRSPIVDESHRKT